MIKTENRVEFTKEMKKDYKILVPMMAPIHFEILKDIFVNEGYDFEILELNENKLELKPAKGDIKKFDKVK